MRNNFFTLIRVKRLLQKLKDDLTELAIISDIGESKSSYAKALLDSFISEPQSWDDCTQYNIEIIGELLAQAKTNIEDKNERLDYILAYGFRFLIERSLSKDGVLSPYFLELREFVATNKDKFIKNAELHITYALTSMSFDIFKHKFTSSDIVTMENFIAAHKSNDEQIKSWRDELDIRKKEVSDLKETLDAQKNAYNFVGLYKGFDDLSEEKKKEEKTASNILLILGFAIFIPIIAELYFILSKGDTLTTSHALITIIPSTSLLLILIYFFRIALHDYKSLKTQINQIELRKSLCKFIQSYAQYSSKIKKDDASALEKFETIIFSNIVMTDDKLPSTFDGIESIANLIKSTKG
ncbi:hypothetical protein [Serratia marcescens]|uniref:hypothetical protein n=1 Tax=Serratia marcescens TaxID=615 RepID=UPI00146B3167|nr:hypothetical protein [Serratia marcescens]NMU40166.1 hypothetical protein [Serratia marcescens]